MVNSSEKPLEMCWTKSFVNSFQMIYVLFQKVLQMDEINMEILMETVKYSNNKALLKLAEKKKNEQKVLQAVIKSLMLDMFKEVSTPFTYLEDEPYSNSSEGTPVSGPNDELLIDEQLQDSGAEECDENLINAENLLRVNCVSSSSDNGETRASSVIGQPQRYCQKELNSDSREGSSVSGTHDQLLLDDEQLHGSKAEKCDENLISAEDLQWVNSASSSSDNGETRASSVIGQPQRYCQKELNSDLKEGSSVSGPDDEQLYDSKVEESDEKHVSAVDLRDVNSSPPSDNGESSEQREGTSVSGSNYQLLDDKQLHGSESEESDGNLVSTVDLRDVNSSSSSSSDNDESGASNVIGQPRRYWSKELNSDSREGSSVSGPHDQLLDYEQLHGSKAEESDEKHVSAVDLRDVNSSSPSDSDESGASSVIGQQRRCWPKELNLDSSEDTSDQLSDDDHCSESDADSQPPTKSTQTHQLLVVLSRLTMPTTSVPRFQLVVSPSEDSPSTSNKFTFTFSATATAENVAAQKIASEKHHICSVCGKSFLQKMSLVLHRRTHLNEENIFTCTVCQRSFSCENLLLLHVSRSHRDPCTTTKTYDCLFCEKTFTRKCHLTRHMRTHGSTQGQSVCFHCGKRFVSFAALVKHRRVQRDKCVFRANVTKQ